MGTTTLIPNEEREKTSTRPRAGRQTAGRAAPGKPFRGNPLLGWTSPDGAPGPWRMRAASVAIHALVVLALLAIPARVAKDIAEPERVDVVFYSKSALPPKPAAPEPVETIAAPIPVAPKPAPSVVEPLESRPRPEPIVARRAPVPPPRVEPIVSPPPPTPKPRQPAARPEPEPAPPVAKPTGAFAAADRAPAPDPRPGRRSPKTAGFVTGAARPSAPQRARRLVADGGFATEAPPPRPAPRHTRRVADRGFTTEAPTPPVEPRQARRIAQGEFATGAPVDTPKTPTPRAAVTETAFEVAAAHPTATAPRPRGAPAAVDFGEAPAPRAARPTTGSVERGGFGTQTVAGAPTTRRARPVESLDTPVEIVSKPKPVYTARARDLRVEGAVVLEVVFPAAGRLRVVRVVEGLGHGLDEAAVEAAKKIEFTPARRNGQPVDHTATLRVVFRLA